MDVDVHLRGDNPRYVHQNTHAVDALNTDRGIEENLTVHVPFCVEDMIAEAALQLVGHRTGTLVNLNLVFVVDVPQDVVARNRMAAVLELILPDGLFADEDRLLAVELLGYDEQFLLFAGTLLLGFVAS